MKIGILTLPFNNNYGGYLQAYALMTVLKDMGHSPTIILRRGNFVKCSLWHKLKNALKSIILSICNLNIDILFHSKEIYFFTRGQKMISFMNKYIQPQTSFVYSTQELYTACVNKFDAFIVGSDQVWRPDYVPDIRNFFLDFTVGWKVRRIAYAASFGSNNPIYTDLEKEACGKLFSNFNAVSVREKSGLNIISNFNWNITNKSVVLDPTMLLSKERYLSLIPSKLTNAKNKVFCYILDESKGLNEIVIRLCNLSQKEKYEFFSERSRNKKLTVLPSIEEWLMNIRDAEYVVTDSFHGMVFSLIFNKKFFIYKNIDRGCVRFKNLLEDFELENRIVCNLDELDVIFKSDINWDYVNKKIEINRIKSMNFLTTALL